MQTADILTKDLPKKLHKRHRDVLFGRKPMEFISVKLPQSHKEYLRRYNEEVERRVKEMKLAKILQEQQEQESVQAE